MRHLRVPNRAVEENLTLLRDRGWLAPGMRVLSHEDGEHRLVPLDPGAPIEMPAPFDIHETVLLEGSLDSRVDPNWRKRLALLVGEEEVAAFGEDWPS